MTGVVAPAGQPSWPRRVVRGGCVVRPGGFFSLFLAVLMLSIAPIAAEPSAEYIKSPYRSLAKTRQLMDASDARVMLANGYEYRPGLRSRLASRPGVLDARVYTKDTPRGSEDRVEIAIAPRRHRRLRFYPIRRTPADADLGLQPTGERRRQGPGGWARPRLRDVPARPHRSRPRSGYPQGPGLQHGRVRPLQQVEGGIHLRRDSRQGQEAAVDRQSGERHQDQSAAGGRIGKEVLNQFQVEWQRRPGGAEIGRFPPALDHRWSASGAVATGVRPGRPRSVGKAGQPVAVPRRRAGAADRHRGPRHRSEYHRAAQSGGGAERVAGQLQWEFPTNVADRQSTVDASILARHLHRLCRLQRQRRRTCRNR